MSRRWVVSLATLSVCLATQALAQTPDERATARELVSKHGGAVVLVMGTAKLRVTQSGKDVPTQDQRIQVHGTVLDGSGLAVMSLTALDPSEMMSAQLSRGRGAGGAITVTAETSDLRYRLADGKEVPVRVVLRDKELDLAFLRPVEKPAMPMAAIEVASARPVAIDPVIVLYRLPAFAEWQASSLFASVQAVIEKPRPFFALTGGVYGSPVFDTRGRFVGVVLRLKNEADPANAPMVVLPANDIREVAKQAN